MKVAECVTRAAVVEDPDDEGVQLWDAIVVPDKLKTRFRNQALLSLILRPQLPFATTALHGLIVLFGPPGTGKTTLARGLPSQLARYVPSHTVRIIEINPHGLMSAEHGQSQQRVNDLLSGHIPDLAGDGIPTVVILDEVESMAVARSAASLAANPADVHRATDAVLTALDENARRHPHILFIATSNFTDALDEAFLSRADAALRIPMPDAEALHQIIRATIQGVARVSPALLKLADSPRLRAVAHAAVGMDGRQTRKLVFEALAQRLETVINPGELTAADLLEAITTTRGRGTDQQSETSDAAA